MPPRRVSVGPIALSFKQFAVSCKDNSESGPMHRGNSAISLNFKQLARRLHGARQRPRNR
jgi:hypothetical protein